MTSLSLRCIADLRSCMASDPRIQALREAEEDLMRDEETKALFLEANAKRDEYLRLRLELGTEDPETVAAQKAFHQAKLALDESPRSAAYSKAFSAVNSLLREIDDIVFGSFRHGSGCGGEHA